LGLGLGGRHPHFGKPGKSLFASFSSEKEDFPFCFTFRYSPRIHE